MKLLSPSSSPYNYRVSGFLSKPEQILSRALFRQSKILNHSLETLQRIKHIAINGICEIFHAKTDVH